MYIYLVLFTVNFQRKCKNTKIHISSGGKKKLYDKVLNSTHFTSSFSSIESVVIECIHYSMMIVSLSPLTNKKKISSIYYVFSTVWFTRIERRRNKKPFLLYPYAHSQNTKVSIYFDVENLGFCCLHSKMNRKMIEYHDFCRRLFGQRTQHLYSIFYLFSSLSYRRCVFCDFSNEFFKTIKKSRRLSDYLDIHQFLRHYLC